MMRRAEWVERFTRELEKLLAAGESAATVRSTHAGIVCGSYDLRVALADPRHMARIAIVVVDELAEHPDRVTLPGTEFHAHLADDPCAIATAVADWLRPRLVDQAA